MDSNMWEDIILTLLLAREACQPLLVSVNFRRAAYEIIIPSEVDVLIQEQLHQCPFL